VKLVKALFEKLVLGGCFEPSISHMAKTPGFSLQKRVGFFAEKGKVFHRKG
jgi:hypothetical protein